MRLTFALLLLAIGTSFALARHSQPFEGTKWKVTVTPEEDAANAGEKPFDDVLIFKGGKFTSEACAKRGFTPVEYHEEMAPGGITASFSAEPISEKEGTAMWHGTITGNAMRGELTWTKKDETVLRFTFQGERIAG